MAMRPGMEGMSDLMRNFELYMIVVSVAVIVVVVVVIVVVMVIVVGMFPLGWLEDKDTSELVRGNTITVSFDIFLSESRVPIVLVPSFRFFSCWAVFSGHHSFHVAPGDLISISKSQSVEHFRYHQG
ncbi:hypothetical protein Tco_0990667 [Tanacetum coccineum]|uniref:Uncharacterized protein n=1 Tax=Tanacetum coccineum TaxID=301880 RepID=A0ABQ5EXV9_9ASTR